MTELEDKNLELENNAFENAQSEICKSNWLTIRKPSKHEGTPSKGPTCDIGVPEKTALKDIFNQILNKNFPDMEKERRIQIQDGQKVSNTRYQNPSLPWHIVSKLFLVDIKKRVTHAHKSRQITSMGAPFRLMPGFSEETL